MALSNLRIEEYVIPCQHIRGYPHASKDPTAVLRLAIKRYTPKRASASTKPAVTVIALHANGIPKETYEPIWEELADRVGGEIKSIWIADVSHQGASGILNERLLGDDPNWFDHSRDLLGMVNHFRDAIEPPVIGIAHSMGCAQLVQLAQIHPALFQSIVLIEPIIQEYLPPGPNAAFMTSHRPDLWRSRDEAQAFFEKNKFYKSWDRRALNKYLRYGLRETPTAIFPDAAPGSVTLCTTKHQEAWSYVRSTFAPRPDDPDLDDQERLLTADYDETQAEHVFHRAETRLAFRALPTLQPAVFWIFGEQSYLNAPSQRDLKISRTGVEARGRVGVSSAVIEGAGHLVPLEKVSETVALLASHVSQQSERYTQLRDFWGAFDTGKSDRDKQILSSQWLAAVRQPSDTKRSISRKGRL